MHLESISHFYVLLFQVTDKMNTFTFFGLLSLAVCATMFGSSEQKPSSPPGVQYEANYMQMATNRTTAPGLGRHLCYCRDGTCYYCPDVLFTHCCGDRCCRSDLSCCGDGICC